jgi:DNA-binding CsgD family transcriptional regulator
MALLSRREWLCCMLTADGHLFKEIALVLGISQATAEGYVRRARGKYTHVGIDAGSKILLRKQLVREAHLHEARMSP